MESKNNTIEAARYSADINAVINLLNTATTLLRRAEESEVCYASLYTDVNKARVDLESILERVQDCQL